MKENLNQSSDMEVRYVELHEILKYGMGLLGHVAGALV